MESSFYLPIFLIAGGIIFMIIFFHYVPFFLWLSAKFAHKIELSKSAYFGWLLCSDGNYAKEETASQ